MKESFTDSCRYFNFDTFLFPIIVFVQSESKQVILIVSDITHLFLMPSAVFPEPGQHQVVSLLGQKLWPVPVHMIKKVNKILLISQY